MFFDLAHQFLVDDFGHRLSAIPMRRVSALA
jgi:hypothetical protein